MIFSIVQLTIGLSLLISTALAFPHFNAGLKGRDVDSSAHSGLTWTAPTGTGAMPPFIFSPLSWETHKTSAHRPAISAGVSSPPIADQDGIETVIQVSTVFSTAETGMATSVSKASSAVTTTIVKTTTTTVVVDPPTQSHTAAKIEVASLIPSLDGEPAVVSQEDPHKCKILTDPAITSVRKLFNGLPDDSFEDDRVHVWGNDKQATGQLLVFDQTQLESNTQSCTLQWVAESDPSKPGHLDVTDTRLGVLLQQIIMPTDTAPLATTELYRAFDFTDQKKIEFGDTVLVAGPHGASPVEQSSSPLKIRKDQDSWFPCSSADSPLAFMTAPMGTKDIKAPETGDMTMGSGQASGIIVIVSPSKEWPYC